MQMAAKFLVFLTLVTAVAAERANPIEKVVELLSALEAKLLKEGEFEEKAYEAFFEWCDDAAKTKQFEIKTAKAQKEKLEATIAKAASDIEEAVASIEALSASIAGDESDLKDATLIREKEHADFAAAEAELMDGIEILGRAIGIIERNMKGGALLQTQVDSTNLNALLTTLSVVIDSASLSSPDKQKLLGFVQNRQGDQDEDGQDPGAPAPDAYKSQSGGIVDILNDMKDKAEAQLSDERKAEVNTQHNYDMLKQSLVDNIAASTHEKEEAEANKGEAEETKAAAEGDLAVTVKDLALAEETLETISSDCMEKASDHDASKAGRAAELKALGQAKKIIQSSTGGAEAQTYSLLQVGASSRLRTAADLRNFEVVNAVKRLAAEHHSAALAQLASRIATMIRYGTASGDDPFVKVKGLIVEMIDKLMKEAAAEASHKAYCDEEMSKTKAKKDELTSEIEKLTAKIDKAMAKSADLKEEVKELQKELADLAKMQLEMDNVRTETHTAFVAAEADLTQGLAGIEGALKVLRDFYAAEEESAFVQQPAPPLPAVHKAAAGAGGSIISFLEVILSDFSKNLAQETAEEEAAQTDYDKLTQENKITKTTKEQDVKYKTKEFTGLDKAVAELSGDRDGAQTELDAVLEYYEKIKDQCIAKPETYEERKKRREAEIAGLKEALSILEGQAFLQQSGRRIGLRGVAAHDRV